ncbi:MAG: hypothetical protein ACOCP8_06830 [archaeon]
MTIEKENKIILQWFSIYVDTIQLGKKVIINIIIAFICSLILVRIAEKYFFIDDLLHLFIIMIATQIYWFVFAKIDDKYSVFTWYLFKGLALKAFPFKKINKKELLFLYEKYKSIQDEIFDLIEGIENINEELSHISTETENWKLRIDILAKKNRCLKNIRQLEEKKSKIIETLETTAYEKI